MLPLDGHQTLCFTVMFFMRFSMTRITVRQMEAMIRISESLAKMELCEDVNVGHVEEAIRLFTAAA
eukprot:1548578-Karenia_brevis.AAC.1